MTTKPRRRRAQGRAFKTPWTTFIYGRADKERRAVHPAHDDGDARDDLSPLPTTLEDIRPHLVGVMRSARGPSLGDEDQ